MKTVTREEYAKAKKRLVEDDGAVWIANSEENEAGLREVYAFETVEELYKEFSKLWELTAEQKEMFRKYVEKYERYIEQYGNRVIKIMVEQEQSDSLISLEGLKEGKKEINMEELALMLTADEGELECDTLCEEDEEIIDLWYMLFEYLRYLLFKGDTDVLKAYEEYLSESYENIKEQGYDLITLVTDKDSIDEIKKVVILGILVNYGPTELMRHVTKFDKEYNCYKLSDEATEKYREFADWVVEQIKKNILA